LQLFWSKPLTIVAFRNFLFNQRAVWRTLANSEIHAILAVLLNIQSTAPTSQLHDAFIYFFFLGFRVILGLPIQILLTRMD